MREIYIKSKAGLLPIGRRGENLASRVHLAEVPESGQAVTVFVLRNGDSASYPASQVEITDSEIIWTVTSVDTGKSGRGKVQYRFADSVTGKVIKTEIYHFVVGLAIDTEVGPEPDPYETWLDSLTELAGQVQIDARAAESAAASAQESAGAASGSAGAAAQSASQASGKATEAAGSATTASQKASEAASSASSAAGSATAASGSASAASQSASQAAASAEAASAFATSAGQSKDTAQTAAQTATTKASEASASATSAASSASTATTKAGEASQSATSAASSASTASTKASEASASATSASGSASTATTKASEASASASAAAGSASSAQTAQAAAEAAQTAAEAAAQTLVIDSTLTQTGKAADAKAAGDAIGGVSERLRTLDDVLVTPIYGKNFLNPSKLTSDNYINWTNGEKASNSAYVCSDYIAVIKGVTYGFSGTKAHFAFYDSNKTFVKKTTNNDITELNGGSVTITSGSAPGQYFVSPIDGYIRYSMNASTVPVGRRVFMAIHSSAELVGTTYPAYVDDVNIEPVDRSRIVTLESELTNIDTGLDNLSETVNENFMLSPNLLNTSDVADGYYLTNTGAVASSASYVTTGYIPCKAGDTIRYQFDYRGTRYDNTQVAGYTKMRFIDAYNSDKTYISGSYATDATTYVCPQNTAFVRITFTKSAFNAGDFSNASIIISDSANVIPFYPYGEIIGFHTHVDAYLPKHIFCAVGRTVELYNNQVCLQADEYHVRWTCNIGKALERKFSVTGVAGQIGEYDLGFTLFNDDSVVLWNGSTTLHVVAELDLTDTYSICPIGDSLTNAKRWMPEVMNLSSDKIAFLGTYSASAQDSDGVSKSFQHEGRSGFSAYNYIAGSPYTFGGATETPHNKFWNGTAFSWSHYKTTYNVNPDAVMVWLGTNGIAVDNTNNAGYIEDIVDIIRADDASIPIYVCNTIYRGNQNALGNQTAVDGYAPNKGAWNYQEKQKVMNLMQILDGLIDGYQNVYLVNLALSHDSEYNYGAVETPVNPRASQTELIPVEATHPQAQGYFQIADIIYSVLCGTIS